MNPDSARARLLLQVAPDDYVVERTRLVKQARADGDRAAASFYQALKRPTLSLWAVLAAGEAGAVHALITATAELAKTQAGGSDAGVLSKATQHRRQVLEKLVDSAVATLARWERGAEARRAEIRGIVDQLSRHGAAAEAWIGGTLRDLPGDAWGFGAFADLEVTPGGGLETPRGVKSKIVAGSAPARPAAPAAPAETGPQRPSKAERTAKVRQARHDVAAANGDLEAAERRVGTARRALREAEKEQRKADEAQAAAQRRVAAAIAALESAQAL